MEIRVVVFYTVALLMKLVFSNVNIVNWVQEVALRKGVDDNNLINKSPRYGSGSNLNQQHFLIKQEQNNIKDRKQGTVTQLQYVANPVPYHNTQSSLTQNSQLHNQERIQNINFQNFQPLDKQRKPNSNGSHHLSNASTEKQTPQAVNQLESRYYNQLLKPKELQANPFILNNENELKLLGTQPKISTIERSRLFDEANTYNKRTAASFIQQHQPSLTSSKNAYQQLQDINSVTNTVSGDMQKAKTHPWPFTHSNKVITPPVITNLPKDLYQGNRQPDRTLLSQDKNINIGIPALNKRYVLIRKNGAVEYYDNLEIIIKKYPHIILPNNIRQANVAQNTNFSKANNLIPAIPMEQKIITPPIAKPLTNSKINVVFDQNGNVRHDVIPNNISNLINNLHGQIAMKSTVGTPLPTIQKLVPLKLNKYIKNSSTIHEENITNNPIKTKIIEDNNITFNKNGTHPSENSNIGTSSKNLPMMHKRFEYLTEKAVIGTSKKKSQESLPFQSNLLNNHSVSAKENTKATEIYNDDYNKNKHITVPETFNKTNERSLLDIIAPTKNKTGSLTPGPLFSNCKTKLQESKDEFDIKVHDSEHLPPVQSVNLTTEKLVNNSSSMSHNDNVFKAKSPSSLDNLQADHHLNVNNGGSLSLDKPVMWIRTSDPDFWEKLLDNDDTYSFVYIFNVSPQYKIEKDTKTTIHANGTTIEEITETVWGYEEDQQPKVTRTVKVTHLDDVTKH